jgi:serine/threonine protein kinase
VAADPYVGRDLANQFRILEKIGSGGMGSVYKAEQPDMRRFVAVKILHPRYLSRADLVSRFRREARAMSHLQHPNTAKVYLYGQLEDGACYFVMEHLAGKNLAQTVRAEGPMTAERAIPIMVQVCGALGEAHQQGIIHRDLKPANVMILDEPAGRDFVKVLDFGVAKLTDPELAAVQTRTGVNVGTPEYMAPEQCEGQDLDGRVDVYGVGVLLYQLVVGKPPFEGSDEYEVLSKHMHERPVPPSEANPGAGVPTMVDAVILQALEKDREHRFADMQRFAKSLAAARAREHESAAAEKPARRSWWSRLWG